MNILLEQSDYFDTTPCCGSSLFGKGAAIAASARDEWSVNDFGYFDVFPIQWRFAKGFEAPMAVYSYEELWVGRDGQLSQLPSNGNEKFRDSLTHFPASADSNFFVAATAEHNGDDWVGHLLVYDLSTFELLQRITHSDYLRPIQFADNARLLVLKSKGLYLLSLADGTLSPLSVAEGCVYVNAHLSSDLRCACAVAAPNHEAEPTGVTITHLEAGVTTKLKFGTNTDIDDQAKWLSNCSIPIRIHNGMTKLVATEVA